MQLFAEVQRKLSLNQPLRAVFLNDTGFFGGAGIGHRRQVQSFLEAGHSVAAICFLDNVFPDPLPPRGQQRGGHWLGLHSMSHLSSDLGSTEDEITSGVVEKVLSFSPDLVVSGNLHWARWPLRILERLNFASIPTIAYLHDCHWLTGRCTYTGSCKKYLEGCDSTCPTPAEYPSADPEKIEMAWQERRSIFAGRNSVPLFANSKWMYDMAISAFHHRATVEFAPLGLDTSLFSPIDRSLARRLLKLPLEEPLVVVGAVDLRESRKGGPLLDSVIENIHHQTSARVVTFGGHSELFRDVISLGVVQDERMMPVIYSAADILIHTAQEESFGQTLMEAAACGIPVISIAAGGMVDIARHGVNGFNIARNDPEAYFQAVKSLIENPALRLRMGSVGRMIAEREYSLTAQYDHWRQGLMDLNNEHLL